MGEEGLYLIRELPSNVTSLIDSVDEFVLKFDASARWVPTTYKTYK